MNVDEGCYKVSDILKQDRRYPSYSRINDRAWHEDLNQFQHESKYYGTDKERFEGNDQFAVFILAILVIIALIIAHTVPTELVRTLKASHVRATAILLYKSAAIRARSRDENLTQ